MKDVRPKPDVATLSPERLDERLTMITGSDAGAILGVSPYNSLYQIWARKMRLVEDKFDGNIKTELGQWLEQFCVYKYEQATGRKCRKVNRTLRMKDYPFIGGHLDRLVEGDLNRGLECKTVSSDGVSKWFNDSESASSPSGIQVPLYYRAQVLHYALVTGRLIWDFSVVFTDGRKDPVFLTIFFTQSDLDDYLARCIDFWQFVESGTPPEVDDSMATADCLKQQWQETDLGSIKVATLDMVEHLKGRFAKKIMRENYEDQQRLHENRINNFMQDAESLISPNGQVLVKKKADKNGRVRTTYYEPTNEDTHEHAATAV